MRKSTRTPFTLIELLTVIAIIAILAGILLPTINTVIKKVNVGKARAEIANLTTAIKQYESTYAILPFTVHYGGSNDVELSPGDYDDLIGILSQSGSAKDLGNVKKMKMLDVKRVNSAGFAEYLDPWGNRYQVVLDLDYDNEILGSDVDGLYDTDNPPRSVVVWSEGLDGNSDPADGNSSNEDNIYPFETNWGGSGHRIRQ